MNFRQLGISTNAMQLTSMSHHKPMCLLPMEQYEDMRLLSYDPLQGSLPIINVHSNY